MRTSPSVVLAMGLCGVVTATLPVSSAPSIPTAATQDMLGDHPGLQAMVQGRGLVALYGVPIATSNEYPEATNTDQFVDAFLQDQDNVDALGVDSADLDFQDKIDIRNGKFTVYTYVQSIQGLPVHGSFVKIPVLLGSQEPEIPDKIGYIGMHLVGLPASPLPQGPKSATEAIAAVQESEAFGHLTDFSPAEKVVYDASFNDLHRAWRFSGSDDDEAYLFFVDTSSAEIIAALDLVLEGDVSGDVYGYGTPGVAASNPNVPETCPDQPEGMPRVEVSIVDGVRVFADSSGHYAFLGLDNYVPITIETRLVGGCGGSADEIVCVMVEPVGEALGPDPPSWPVTPIPEGITGVDFEFNPTEVDCPAWPDGEPLEFDIAQVNGFLAAQKTYDWFNDLQPTFTGIDRTLTVRISEEGGGGAFVAPDVISISSAVTYSTYLSHEYGHYIHFSIGRIFQYFGPHDPQAYFREGMADTVATLLWNTPYVFLELQAEGDPTFDRRVDEPDMDFRDPTPFDEVDWCHFGEMHCMGLALAGAFWDLREELLYCTGNEQQCPPACTGGQECVEGVCLTECTDDADCEEGDKCISGLCREPCADDLPCDVQHDEVCTDRATEELFADFLLITDGHLDDSIIVEVLFADDDNANLRDGTPNYDAIVTAFGLHGWSDPFQAAGECVGGANEGDPCACPGGECVVDTCVGGDRGGEFCDDALNCDGGMCTSTVKVEWEGPLPPFEEPEAGTDYFVHYDITPPSVTLVTTKKGTFPVAGWYVGRVVNGEPGDLGSVTASWTPPRTFNSIVEVGTILGPPCLSVSIVDVPAQSINNYSNIVLQLGGRCVGGEYDGILCDTDEDCPDGSCKTGDLSGYTECAGIVDELDPDFGKGGLVSGIITGTAFAVTANGIGEADETLGTLKVGSSATVVLLDTLLAQSELLVGGDIALVRTNGELNGTVNVEGSLIRVAVLGDGLSEGSVLVGGDIYGEGANSVTISGDMSGNIYANGNISGEVTIEGDMYGNIHADYDEVDGGVISGTVTVSGVFSGDLCSASLRSFQEGDELPENIDITFGPDGTICGQRACPKANSRVIYVDELAAQGQKTGLSWQDAYTNLQDALYEAASRTTAVEIWVAAGTYTPDPEQTGDRELTFELQDRVLIFGGFAGTENNRCARTPDPQSNVTILSGDLGNDDDEDLADLLACFSGDGIPCDSGCEPFDYDFDDDVDAEDGGMTDNSYHVVTGAGTGKTALLDRVVVTAGSADGSAGLQTEQGGGLYIPAGGSPNLTNCTFRANYALSGGGMFVGDDANPKMTDCLFDSNAADYDGGGTALDGAAVPVFTRCDFTHNVAVLDGGGVDQVASTPIFAYCRFLGNSAGDWGGGMSSAVHGPTLSNCLFSGNTSDVDGGGLFNLSGNTAFENCTFSENHALSTGGGMLLADGSVTLDNCILWGNIDGGSDVEEAQIFIEWAMPTIKHCCIQEWSGLLGGAENNGDDPEFVDPLGEDETFGTEDDDLRLYASSPCIDTGDDTAVTVGTDIIGNDRIYNEAVDRGAYELQCLPVSKPTLDPRIEPNPPTNGTRNRYVSFVPGDETEPKAFRVTLVASGDDPDYTCGNGTHWWVPEPNEVREASGSNNPIPPPTFWAAQLADDREGNELNWNGYGVVHTYAAGVIPGSLYHIQAIRDVCNGTDESHFSAPLEIYTSAFGDVVGDCGVYPCTAPNNVVDFRDISAVVDKYKNEPTAPQKARADLGNSDILNPLPDRIVDFVDITMVDIAFHNEPYPYPVPSCP